MGRQDYHWQHEPVLYGWKSTGSHHWYADRKQTTIPSALCVVAGVESLNERSGVRIIKYLHFIAPGQLRSANEYNLSVIHAGA